MATRDQMAKAAMPRLLAALVVAVALPVSPAEAVALNAGDIIATGVDSLLTGHVVRIDPVTGARTVISSGGLFGSPQGVAIDSAGQILIADPQEGIIKVDPATGTQTLVSAGGILSHPFGVAVEATGHLIVNDPGSLIRIDPATGIQTLLSSGGLLEGSADVAIDARGDIFVVGWFYDEADEAIGQVVRVDPSTGIQTLVATSRLLGERSGIDVDAAGRIVAVNDGNAVTVDPDTGDAALISSGGLMWSALGVAVDGIGRFVVADWGEGIIRVDPSTGGQMLLTPADGPLTLVWGVAVALPDLVQTALSEPPPLAQLGHVFFVTDTAENRGSVAAVASTTRYFLSPDAVPGMGDVLLIGSRGVPALSAGAVSTGIAAVSVGAKTPPGTYYLLACADADDIVTERWSSNNCRSSAGQIEVRAPDLVAVKANSPPAVVVVGGTFVAGDRVVNRGNMAADISSTRYYLSVDQTKDAADRPLTGSRAVPALAPGAASEGTVTVTVPSVAAGTYYVIACADNTGRVAESAEDNNCLASSGKVKIAGPDLVVTSIGNPPATAARGGTFSMTASVRNQGSVAAAASTLRYYLSGDAARGGGDIQLSGGRAIPGLAPSGASSGPAAVGVPAATPAGSYYVLACADDAHAVVETSETNNCRASESRVAIDAIR